jgi:hypothetical protein
MSVKHSGTHYTHEHLRGLGFYNQSIDCPMADKYFLHNHVESGAQITGDSKVILTLRNPINVFQSHVYRYDWLDDEYEARILYAFERWDAVRKEADPFIFQVDAPDQKSVVDALADWMGVDRAYKEQPRNINTHRVGPNNPEWENLHDNPPESIVRLAQQHGYN